MEKNLPVPYKSQHDPDSTGSNNDCGPASLAMVMEFLGKPHSVGGVLKKLGNPTGFTTITQLAKVAQDQGFNVESKVDATFGELKKYIDKGLPVIVVGGYGYLNSTQDKNFKASHIMVVCGYRADDGVYVNDPNFWGELRSQGDHHNYTGPEFFTFWRNEGNKEGNQPNILFVVSPKPQETTAVKIKISTAKGLILRKQPVRTADTVLRTAKVGEQFNVIAKVNGDNVDGNASWYQVDGGYLWSGGVEVVKEEIKEVKKETDWEVVAKEAIKQRDEAIAILSQVDKIVHEFISSPAPSLQPDKISWWDSLLEKLRIKK